MKVAVDPQRCDGCGPCEDICPEVFEITDHRARVKVREVPPEAEDACRKAAQECPANAILIEE